MRKAQASMEFIMAIGFVLVVFLVIFGFVFDKREELRTTKLQVEKKALCSMLLGYVVSAYNIGDGTEITVDVDYDLSIEKGMVHIGEYSCPSFIDIVSYAGEDIFNINKGGISIKNNKGIIEVSNV